MILHSFSVSSENSKLIVSESVIPNTLILTLRDVNGDMSISIDRDDWRTICKLTDDYSSNFKWSGHEE